MKNFLFKFIFRIAGEVSLLDFIMFLIEEQEFDCGSDFSTQYSTALNVHSYQWRFAISVLVPTIYSSSSAVMRREMTIISVGKVLSPPTARLRRNTMASSAWYKSSSTIDDCQAHPLHRTP